MEPMQVLGLSMIVGALAVLFWSWQDKHPD
jgi:hypothetical protein